MPEYVISLAVQLPLVGLFIWFILEWNKRMSAAEDARLALRIKADQDRDSKLSSDLAARDAEWRAFLTEQRTQKHAESAEITAELRDLSRQIAANTAIIMQHDARTAAILTAHGGKGPEPKERRD